jgi:hypothetical protein
VTKFNEYGVKIYWDDGARKTKFWNGLKSRIKTVIAVVSYSKNFKDMVTLTVRLNDSFARLNDLKKMNPTKYPNKKKDSNAIN